MVESPDPERTDGTPLVMPRLLAVALVAAIALGGLALIPSQDSLVAEPALSEALPEPITEASLLDRSAPIEEVAASFMAAWVEGDGRSAAAEFASDGLFYGFAEYETGMLPVLRDWYRSVGVQYQDVRCQFRPTNAVWCRYTFENKMTLALNRDRLTSSFQFFIEEGAIERVREHSSLYTVGPYSDIWNLFLEWVKIRAESNFDRMYDSDASHPLLDPTSIDLWERHSDDFAASAPHLTEARAICRTATDRFDAAMTEFEATRPPGPGPTLEDMAAGSKAAVEFSEQAVAELRALPPLFGTHAPFDVIILIWEAKIDHNRQLAAAASANDGPLVSVLREKRGPEVCPAALY
jgi:hypothetical protein